MLVKLAVLLFCCALISAKSLVRQNPRHESQGEIQYVKIPSDFRDLFRDVENNDVIELRGENIPGVDYHDEVDAEEEEDEEESNEENKKMLENDNFEEKKEKNEEENTKDEKEDEDEDEDKLSVEEEEKEGEKNTPGEENKDEKGKTNIEEEEEEEEDEEEEKEDKEEGKNTLDGENKDQKYKSSVEEDNEDEEENALSEKLNESSNEETLKEDTPDVQLSDAFPRNEIKFLEMSEFPKQSIDLPLQPKKISAASNLQSSNAIVENEINIPDTFKFPKQMIDLLAHPKKISTVDDTLAGKVTNFFALESIIKNFIPSKDALPKEINEKTKTDEESVMMEIEQLEKNNNAVEEKLSNKDAAQKLVIDIDLDSNPLVDVAAPAIPKNLAQIQATLQRAKKLWQKTNVNDIKAKVQQGVQDFWQKINFNDLHAKFQKGFNGLSQENIKEDARQLIDDESKVGFGGQNNKQSKLMFANATAYVNKAVQRAQIQLSEKGQIVYANNPPLTINLIPGTPITLKLKYVKGADTLSTYGQSKTIHYNKLYGFTQYKFTELKYYYDIIISPYNLYNIRKSFTVILKDAPAKMNVAVEKDNKMNILGFEFVNPMIMVDCGSHRFINYGINYLINDVQPVIKQKLVEIVSRDTKLLLTDYMKDAQ